MKREKGLGKHALVAFGIAALFYIVAFWWIEHHRVSKGPWEVTFLADQSGTPAVLVAQPTLHISKKIIFSAEKLARTNYAQVIRFDVPVQSAPFGLVVFQDPTILPGTVTLNLFDHEVEFLPRVLILDRQEIPWQSGKDISVTTAGKFPPVKAAPK